MARRTSSTTRPTEPASMSDRTRRSEINRSSGTERTASTGRLGPYESQYEISMGYGSDRSITVR